MHIKSIGITNYKSFYERQILYLEPGFNLLVGSNNSGKTSILDVLDLENQFNEPHRSELTLPEYGNQPIQTSQIEVTISTRFSELWRRLGSSRLYLPLKDAEGHGDNLNVLQRVKKLVSSDCCLQLTATTYEGKDFVSFAAEDLISGVVSRYTPNEPSTAALIHRIPISSDLRYEVGNFSDVHGVAGNYVRAFNSLIYRFSAQRRPGYQCAGQQRAILDREATTLPYCLNHLQTNDSHGHRILCNWINRVFPSVKWVQSTSNVGSFDLRCLPLAPEARRDDLAIPMARMGAGIGNVIAMLYVVMTSREPQVIAIDEPNAFLHPRALRELLAILEVEGKQHQFILTAHSADVLTSVSSPSISFLNFDGIKTAVLGIGIRDLHHVRSELAELGIRMTDLHSKDRVLWVEGQTEELVMPELLRWACPEVAAGTSILRVERTGTFNKKSIEPQEIAKIYERLSSASALVPPMVCILLDGDSRSKQERLDIESTSKGKLRFLDRRMLENFLLHPEAIAIAISEQGVTATKEAVAAILARRLASDAIEEIDGAAILKNIFSEISNATAEFRKTRDVPTIVDWLLKNDTDHLLPLAHCLRISIGLEREVSNLAL